MGQRVIPVAVTAEYIGGDGVTLGAAGSHNSVLIEYDFRSAGPQWDDISGRYVLWTNPQGNSTNRINLGVSEKVEGYEGVYQAAPPADAMCVPGWAEMVVVGYTLNGETEVTKIKTEPSRFRVLPGSSRAADNEGVAPTVADQLQADIETVDDRKVNKPTGAYDKDGTSGQVLVSLGDGKTKWATIDNDEIETAIDKRKVNKPVAPNDPNGEKGQVLMSLGGGETQWGDFDKSKVEEVLNDHLDWVTTVQDGAIGKVQLDDSVYRLFSRRKYFYQDQRTMNAGFPSVCYFNGTLYGGVRVGMAHASFDGELHIINVETGEVIRRISDENYDLRDAILWVLDGKLYCSFFGRHKTESGKRTSYIYDVEAESVIHTYDNCVFDSAMIEYGGELYIAAYDWENSAVILKGTDMGALEPIEQRFGNTEFVICKSNNKLYGLRRIEIDPGQLTQNQETEILLYNGETFQPIFTVYGLSRALYDDGKNIIVFVRVKRPDYWYVGGVYAVAYNYSYQISGLYLLNSSETGDCGYTNYTESPSGIWVTYFAQTGDSQTSSFFENLCLDKLEGRMPKIEYWPITSKPMLNVLASTGAQLINARSLSGYTLLVQLGDPLFVNSSQNIRVDSGGLRVLDCQNNGNILVHHNATIMGDLGVAGNLYVTVGNVSVTGTLKVGDKDVAVIRTMDALPATSGYKTGEIIVVNNVPYINLGGTWEQIVTQ